MNSISDFMIQLHTKFLKEKKVKANSANTYIQNLYLLNNKRAFNNLAFLKKYGDIQVRLHPYANTTIRNYIATIVSALSLYKDKPSYKKAYDKYSQMLNAKNGEIQETKGEMTAKQKENFMEWKDIIAIRDELKNKVDSFKDNTHLTKNNYQTLLQYVILSLYTYLPPRRNRDFQEAYFVSGKNDKRPNDKNYYNLENGEFTFNAYKTAKKYGPQMVQVPKELQNVLKLYYSKHPLKKSRLSKSAEVRMLVNQDGSVLPSTNSITRILNKCLKKKIGSSMLRHIYLTSKYGDEMKEREQDANAMGHSVSQQKDYIFKGEPQNQNINIIEPVNN